MLRAWAKAILGENRSFWKPSFAERSLRPKQCLCLVLGGKKRRHFASILECVCGCKNMLQVPPFFSRLLTFYDSFLERRIRTYIRRGLSIYVHHKEIDNNLCVCPSVPPPRFSLILRRTDSERKSSPVCSNQPAISRRTRFLKSHSAGENYCRPHL